MDLVNKSNYKIILGSGSSRRSELLGMTGINFTVNSIPVDESFPDYLQGAEISDLWTNVALSEERDMSSLINSW